MTKTPRLALWLLVAVAATTAGCSGSDDVTRKKDAAPTPADDAEVVPDTSVIRMDTAAASDTAAADVPASPDVPAVALDTAPPDTASPDAAIPDAAAPDAAPPDSAPDVARDASPDVVAMCGRIKCDCTLNGKRLYGRYTVDNVFPDFKVKEVTVFEDLRVQQVTVFADSCGKWQRDDVFPDFKVKFVDVFEDFSIRYVTVFPGIP